MVDPRKAKTLDEASRNDDGSYNGVKALSWLFEVLFPGNGMDEAEVLQLVEEVKQQHGQA
jgi:hypothetical protein